MARGDQIYALREFINFEGVYEHHGIDRGDGTVIHYRKPSEIVERTSLEVFARGQTIYVKEYLDGFCFLPDVTIDRAESRLGEKKYNLLFNNCEHFATWCKTGINDSKQIREFVPSIDRLNPAKLYEPIDRALREAEPNNAQNLLNQALQDIRIVWDRIQPQYADALAEIEIWQQIARQALQQNREDLARGALKRKLEYQKRASEFKEQLDHLATMTQTLIGNSSNLSTK
jgi:hypothetical protein